ncbi:homoserine dehydrogenase [Aquitalea sp. LB_tupeE]|uniref:homoserine dehydrogenase n=1 Tax=Aquitalea sp. LB_tupeE TaxID=2748078 RepID=UPI0015BAF176|nr:homoserine dehydrogenase [Aquitalea sp. LB_tupeE]NWK78791.1 homoserine dehydrogenase [Aquitalea sp. LB_tupeE]
MNYRLALIGFGGVNQGLVDLLWQKRVFTKNNDIEFKITVIADLRFGIIKCEDGFDLNDLKDFISSGLKKDKFTRNTKFHIQENSDINSILSVIEEDFVDIVVEATFTDPNTGEPALSHCKHALSKGKHVVTTNKGPVALALGELMEIAKSKNVCFKYEGAVMSGTPVLRQITKTLKGADVNSFAGILNGTSNFVLEEMSKSISFDSAVKKAQELGYAEANPAADVEGYDVQLKVIILANALWGEGITRDDVPCRGITNITTQDIISAQSEGYTWRLVGSAKKEDSGKITASVQPKKIRIGHPLTAASGVTNAISFETDVVGTVTISGPGAGRIETAFAIFSDLIELSSEQKDYAVEKKDLSHEVRA